MPSFVRGLQPFTKFDRNFAQLCIWSLAVDANNSFTHMNNEKHSTIYDLVIGINALTQSLYSISSATSSSLRREREREQTTKIAEAKDILSMQNASSYKCHEYELITNKTKSKLVFG